jgi:hypothetical protein
LDAPNKTTAASRTFEHDVPTLTSTNPHHAVADVRGIRTRRSEKTSNQSGIFGHVRVNPNVVRISFSALATVAAGICPRVRDATIVSIQLGVISEVSSLSAVQRQANDTISSSSQCDTKSLREAEK